MPHGEQYAQPVMSADADFSESIGCSNIAGDGHVVDWCAAPHPQHQPIRLAGDAHGGFGVRIEDR